MSYEDIGSMGDFMHEVNMQANFADSEIDSDDIAFFAPLLNHGKRISGSAGR